MDIEDKIRRWDETIAKAASAVEEIKEYSDPAEFEKSFENVLKNRDISPATFWGDLFNNAPKEQREFLEKQINEYRDLKGLMLQVYKHSSPEDPAVKTMMDFNPATIFSVITLHDTAFGGYMGTYARLTTNCLAFEIIEAFKGRELSEAEKLNDIVDELNEDRRYEEALPYSEKALSLSPRFCLAWINRGISLKNLGRFDEAIKCYDKTIEINPLYKKAWYNKAVALYFMSNFDEARKCVDKALEINPNYPHALSLKIQLG